MDWFDCPHCIYRHPFEVNKENVCPNRSLSKEWCREIFNKDSVLQEGVETLPPGPVKRAFVPARVLNKINVDGLKVKNKSNKEPSPVSNNQSNRDVVSLTSIPHPPGALEKIVAAITDGRLDPSKAFDKAAYQREYMRKRREAAKKKSDG